MQHHAIHVIHHRKQRWTATKTFLLCVLISAVGVSLFFVFRGNNGNNTLQTVLVGRGDVVQEVSVTGRIKPVQDINLGFEQMGKITRVLVNIGDKVLPGQALIQLDTSGLSAQLLEAEAGVESQVAKLNELQRGARPEELKIKEAELEKAQKDLTNYYASVYDVLSDSYAKADDAVRSKTDALFTNDDTSMVQPAFSITNSQVQVDLTAGRLLSGQELSAWKSELAVLTSDVPREKFELSLNSAKKHLAIINNFLGTALDAVSNSAGVSLTDITTYKANIAVGRTNVNTAISNISSQEQLISGQKITVAKNEQELALQRAGSSTEQIAGQAASVKQAEAKKQEITVQIEKMTLRSPIEGLITKQDGKPGEIVSPNVSIVSIISQNNLEIEASVPEIDIGLVTIGNPVAVTIDAFQGEMFRGKVSYIDPGETIIDGVVNFKITVVFDIPDLRFKTGLTANLAIETLKKTDVVVVPQFAIVENDEGTFARKIEGISARDVPVKLGIRSREGNIEIVSGLREGDRVVNVGFKPK